MKKQHQKWSVDNLVRQSNKIEFPEFQREPTVWKLEKKQRLIDSILRDFDIASIYLHKKKDGKYECIDGLQRINAIWSYIGINNTDDDNMFNIKITNEIYHDGNKFVEVDEKRFEHLDAKWKKKILEFELNIVLLEDIKEDDELNLQFLRLQLGAALNAGEKLNAMTGSMRNKIFIDLRKLSFFTKIKIQQRRFALEQVIAQILINLFSKKEFGEFHRSRYIDLQEFFKTKEKFTKEDIKSIQVFESLIQKTEKAFGEKAKYINNRALAVSVALFNNELIEQKKENELPMFSDFFVKFMKTLKWQIPKGIEMNKEYRELLNFQTNISQAAGEKTAIQKRHDFLREYFYYFKKEKKIKGDKEFKGNADKLREHFRV